MNPFNELKNVLFPDPFGPMKTMTSPCFTEIEKFWRAFVSTSPWQVLLRFSISKLDRLRSPI
jgi:hypothetical protein